MDAATAVIGDIIRNDIVGDNCIRIITADPAAATGSSAPRSIVIVDEIAAYHRL